MTKGKGSEVESLMTREVIGSVILLITQARSGSCRLAEIDPWGSDVRPHLDPSYDPFNGCTPTLKRKARVRNGKIEVNGEYQDHSCEFRCNYPINDWDIRFGQWLNVSLTPDCDVFEVRCRDAEGKLDYTFLHAQIYRNESQKRPETASVPRKEAAENDLPDVYLIVLDSVSTPQVLRSWPKTMRVLREELGGILFPFVNKVGESSTDNGFAMLLGKQSYSLPRRAGHDAVPADELCRRAMDNETFIGYEFSRRGYASMMCEDWYTIMNYPKCVGFRKPPADHYFVPFALRYDWSKEGKEDRTLYNTLEKSTCTPQYRYSLDYLSDFIDAYPDRPKWTMTWISTLAHNNVNSLYPADEDFANFFKQRKEKMRNAFLFIVGDHGLRHSSVRQTKQGALEDYNPVSIVVVPEHLRTNEHLMANLRKNAQQLTTHYDLYATLQNVARDGGRMTSGTLFDRLNTSGWGVTLHGESSTYSTRPFHATA